MYPLTTTTRRLMAHHPCKEGIARLAAHLGTTEPNDQPIGYDVLLDALDLDDALWCCRAEPQHDRIWRRHVVWCARQVQHLMTDERSLSALDVAERHANGEATDEQLAAARAAAGAAARAAEWDAVGAAEWDAVGAAALAAARAAAGAAARAAEWDAAWAAAWAAARDAAGDAARAAAWYAAWDAARAAMRDRQAAAFRQLVTTGTLPD